MRTLQGPPSGSDFSVPAALTNPTSSGSLKKPVSKWFPMTTASSRISFRENQKRISLTVTRNQACLTLRRRKLIRNSSFAAGALLAANPTKIFAEDKMDSVFHVFAFQWKPQATEAEKEQRRNTSVHFKESFLDSSKLTSVQTFLPGARAIASAASCNFPTRHPWTPMLNIQRIKHCSNGWCR